MNSPRTSGHEVPQLMERAFIRAAAALAAFATPGTVTVRVDAAASHNLRLREIFHPRDSLCAVRHVFPWPRHKYALLGMLEKASNLAEMAKKFISG